MPPLHKLALPALLPLLLSACSTDQTVNYSKTYAKNYVTNAALNELGPAGDAISIGMGIEKDTIGFEALVHLLYQSCFLTTVMSMGSWTIEQGGMTSNSRAIARNSNAELKFR